MSGPFDALRDQLLAAAEALSDGPAALPQILAGMVDDVDHALCEPLEIFPVCHHSPASALAMVAGSARNSRRSSTWSCAKTWRRC